MIKNSLKALLTIIAVCATSFSLLAETTVILDENFAAFTEGSEQTPGSDDISSYSGGNKLSKTLTGWSGRYVYEAGGKLFVSGGGNLQTARYSMSTTNGNSKVTVRLKAKESYGDMVTLNVYYSTIATILLPDGEWHDYSFVTDKGTASSFIKIAPTLNGVFVGQIKIEQSKEFVMVPEAYQPTAADGTSFTATWKRITGATYLLNVYTKNEAGEREYFLKDQESTLNNYKVTGLTEGKKYFFNVRAKVGENVSDESEEIEVIKVIANLDAPVVKAATNVTENGFTANWEAVKDAENYELSVYSQETFNENTTKTILSEDFSKVTIGKFDSVDFGKTQEELNDYTKIPGWYGEYHAFAAGYMVLSPFSGDAKLTTPVLSMGNKVTVKLNMAEAAYGKYYTGGQLTVSLYNETETSDELAESKVIEITDGEFKDYTFTSSKGSDKSYLVFSYSGSNKIFFDNIEIEKDFVAGEKLSILVSTLQTAETSAKVDMTFTTGLDYFYSVSAIATTVDSSGNIVTINSEESDLMKVERSGSSVESNTSDVCHIYSVDGAIVINAVEDTQVYVYNLAGSIVAKASVGAGETALDMTNGIYIVKAGDKAVKVAVK